MSNARDFALRLDAHAAVVRERATDLHRQAHVELHDALVEATPKRSGRAAAGWMASIGAPAVGAPSEGLGSYEPQDARRALSSLKVGRVSHETNNIDYIDLLNNGSSSQAGAGFVERVTDRFGSGS